jgi:hypothetical protein
MSTREQVLDLKERLLRSIGARCRNFTSGRSSARAAVGIRQCREPAATSACRLDLPVADGRFRSRRCSTRAATILPPRRLPTAPIQCMNQCASTRHLTSGLTRQKDPDTHSPTLRQYHKLLWSKPLPSGRPFYLSDATPRVYLHHHSELGEFFLSSDSVIATFTRWKSLRHIAELFPVEANEAFRRVGYTIGAMIVFPGNRIDGKQTINGARGFNRRIADRFDLTLECVRRHYLGQSSPLGETLSRYREFFALFESFRGYVDFFMLYDLVTEDCSAVKFFMPFDDFSTPSVPLSVSAYGKQTLFQRRSSTWSCTF